VRFNLVDVTVGEYDLQFVTGLRDVGIKMFEVVEEAAGCIESRRRLS
jgi:hypothetical protein